MIRIITIEMNVGRKEELKMERKMSCVSSCPAFGHCNKDKYQECQIKRGKILPFLFITRQCSSNDAMVTFNLGHFTHRSVRPRVE
ncbi:hypothetical protein EJB05_36729, partial [Eragrostis curvula]